MRERSEIRSGPPGMAPLVVLGVAALLVAGGGVVGVVAARSRGSHGVMWGGVRMHAAPVAAPASAGAPTGFQLQGLPPDVVEQYTFARENPDVYAQIPCFCGCQRLLGHRNLADCFVTPQGTWESHAAGCAVCLGESEMVMRMMVRGMGPSMMRERIVERFGGPPAGIGMEVD